MRAIYYDTETTGTRPDRDRIIEIAAYDPARESSYVQLINPGCPIPSESTEICGITDEMVAGAQTFEIVGQEFIEFCGPDAVLIAHNNDRFDKLFLEAETSRVSLALPAWKWLDSLKWSRKYRSDLPSHSLQALREIYGFEANQAHRALDDVMTLYRVFSAMTGDLSIDMILSLLSQTTDAGRMPFGKHQGKLLSEVPPGYLEWLKSSGALDKSENKELKEAILALK